MKRSRRKPSDVSRRDLFATGAASLAGGALLLRGRDELHRGLNAQVFEREATMRFEIVGAHPTSPTRSLYVLRKR